MCCLCTSILADTDIALSCSLFLLTLLLLLLPCQLFAVVPLNSLAGTVNVGVPQKYWGTKVEPGAEWCYLCGIGGVGACSRFMCAFCLAHVVLCVYVYVCVCGARVFGLVGGCVQWLCPGYIVQAGASLCDVFTCKNIHIHWQHDCGFIFSSSVCAVD